MPVRAGLQFKPSGQPFSSKFLQISSRLFRSVSVNGSHHLTMSYFSCCPTCSIVAACPPQSCSVSKHSLRNQRTELVYVLPSVRIIHLVGSCRNVTVQSHLSGGALSFSREMCAAASIPCSSDQGFSRCVLPVGCSIWKRWTSEHRTLIPGREYLKCTVAENHQRVSGVSMMCRSLSLFWFRDHGKQTRGNFGRESKFHTAARQEGRYICAAAAQQECTFEENWVEIDQENETARGYEPVGSNALDLEENESCAPEIWVVNFYHFVCIEDPHLEVARHTSFLEGMDVRGRIYISHQGINAQLSGPRNKAMKYAEWVKEDSRFSNMLVQTSPSHVGHAFPRLRLRYKSSLVQVEGGTLHLPLTNPSARATRLTPREWTERLDAAIVLSNSDAAVSQELDNLRHGHHDEKDKHSLRSVILLDVRNGYEWDVGHFSGAQRPNVDCFKSTEFGLTENKPISSDPLANVDKEKVDVMMYCTGGIRCDVFSTMLRQKGFTNLYTLKGGVSNYLKEEGARKWAGNLFVFDSRLAVSPKAYHMKGSAEQNPEYDTTEGMDCASSSAAQGFARCRLCGDPISEPRHRNCANLDCNLLYMACEDCLSQHKGCCSQSCSIAPKLRPLLASHQYDRWHNYRPQEPKPPKPADYVSKRAMKRRRRKERRKQLTGDKASEQLNVHIL